MIYSVVNNTSAYDAYRGCDAITEILCGRGYFEISSNKTKVGIIVKSVNWIILW